MFHIDIIFSFLFMSLLFARQIMVFKDLNKINYAPLILSIGAISSIIHFVINSEVTDVSLLLRTSFMPLLFSLFLYVVMNVIYQTQRSNDSKMQLEISNKLFTEIADLKQFIFELENRMERFSNEEKEIKDDVNIKFKQDMKSLEALGENQLRFNEKFDDIIRWNQKVSKAFEHFSAVEIPEFDDIVHKHINILQVSEQDHYNKLQKIIKIAFDERSTVLDELNALKDSLDSIKSVSKGIADEIVSNTTSELSHISNSFLKQIKSLYSYSEGIDISMKETETVLSSIRGESEIVMRQMLLSSNKVEDIQIENQKLKEVYHSLKSMIDNIVVMKEDYAKATYKLNSMTHELHLSENDQILTMQKQIENLSETLSQKIDTSLEKLHEHYHITDTNISNSVQMLTKKAQLQKGYTQLDD